MDKEIRVVVIECHDCGAFTNMDFNIPYNKCAGCGSYNCKQQGKSLVYNENGGIYYESKD